MPLPEKFVKDHVEKSKGMLVFGIKIENLSKEELTAIAVYSLLHAEQERIEHTRWLSILR